MWLLNCLCAAIPAQERVITCEEVFELRVPLPDVVAMQTRQPNLEGAGEIPLRRLVKEALRMRPSRIVVGEVRQEECLDLLIALNSGLPGMCTLHANSAREAVVKMCTLPLLAGENIGTAFVVPNVRAHRGYACWILPWLPGARVNPDGWRNGQPSQGRWPTAPREGRRRRRGLRRTRPGGPGGLRCAAR